MNQKNEIRILKYGIFFFFLSSIELRNILNIFFFSNLHRIDTSRKHDFSYWSVFPLTQTVIVVVVVERESQQIESNGNYIRLLSKLEEKPPKKTKKPINRKIYMFRMWWKCSKIISINFQWDWPVNGQEMENHKKSSKMNQTQCYFVNKWNKYNFRVRCLLFDAAFGFDVFNIQRWILNASISF